MEPECETNYTLDTLTAWEYTKSSRIFVTVFVPFVVLFGVVSNCAFVFVVYRVKFMRNITNIYLVNLAIADSSLLIAGFVQYIGDYIICPEYDLRFSFYTSFGCSVPNFLIYLCYYASLWTVTLVTMERYLAICHTFWHRIISDQTRAIRMVVVVWLVSLFFAGFAAPYKGVTLCGLDGSDIVFTAPFCMFICTWCSGALFMTDLIQFVFTLSVNLIMYTLIVYQLGKAVFPISNNSNNESDIQANIRAAQTRNAVAKMLIINGVLFFICLTPFSVANVESVFKHFDSSVFNEATIVLLSWIGRVLFLINSAVNPLVYSCSNPRYRMAFYQAFGWKHAATSYQQGTTTNHPTLKSTISQNSQNTKVWHSEKRLI